jgi:hypothetical protein
MQRQASARPWRTEGRRRGEIAEVAARLLGTVQQLMDRFMGAGWCRLVSRQQPTWARCDAEPPGALSLERSNTRSRWRLTRRSAAGARCAIVRAASSSTEAMRERVVSSCRADGAAVS